MPIEVILVGGTVTQPPPPPPPPSAMVMGTSAGANKNITLQFIKAHLLRVFNTGQWPTDKTVPLCHSEKSGTVMATRSTVIGSAYQTEVTRLINVYTSMPDIDGCWGVDRHEPENDGNSSITSAQWLAIQHNLAIDVFPKVNQNRTHPVRHNAILMGSTIASGTPNGPASEWAPQSLIDDLALSNGSLGIDVYSASAFTKILAWLEANPYVTNWSIPERGTILSPGPTDAAMVNTLDSDMNVLPTATTFPVPDFYLYFNGEWNTCVAVLGAAAAAGATTIRVNNAHVPAGSTFILEKGTARQESVTVGTRVSVSNLVDDYPVTSGPLQFSHASGTNVITRPNGQVKLASLM